VPPKPAAAASPLPHSWSGRLFLRLKLTYGRVRLWWHGLSLRTKILGLAALALVITAMFLWRQHADKLASVTTATVVYGDVEDTVTALGNLQPLNYVDVGAQVSGQLDRLPVDYGTVVKKGDLLAEINAQVQSARVAADQAQLANFKAQLTDKIAQRDLAQQQFDRQKRLQRDNATSTDAYQSAEASLRSAKAQVDALTAQSQQTQSTLDADQVTLGYSKIYAPMAGTVVSLTARQGQTLNANQTAPIILRVADLSTMTVWTQVSEADIVRLRPNMDAYFTTLGTPSKKWTGKLRQILPTPDVTNNVVLYTALFDVANPTGELLTQMSAQVFFIAAAAHHVLTVPVSALHAMTRQHRPAGGQAGGWQAGGGQQGGDKAQGAGNGARHGKPYRVTVIGPGGIFSDRVVRIGVTDRVTAEVVSGLSEGETVVSGQKTAGTAANGRPAASSARPAGLGGGVGGGLGGGGPR
jgi:macrolide-specific efflux system membrane fusion protein